jgi:hypothetical protein
LSIDRQFFGLMSEHFPIHGFEDCFGPVELLSQVYTEFWPGVFHNDLAVIVVIPSVSMLDPKVALAVVVVDPLHVVVDVR